MDDENDVDIHFNQDFHDEAVSYCFLLKHNISNLNSAQVVQTFICLSCSHLLQICVKNGERERGVLGGMWGRGQKIEGLIYQKMGVYIEHIYFSSF